MDASPSKPARIGAYEILDIIGRGGMGIVYRGNDPRVGRPVAIKVFTAAADPDLLQRFYREAKYTGSLHHQNIVTVYESGQQDSIPYIVMEYLQGTGLDAVIASGRPKPMAEKLGIILQVCSGLAYAHKQGLVHRDIKPANIVILEDGTAKIVDFGIAFLAGGRLAQTGGVVGSLNYMSPEQLSGDADVDARSDVYSTGVVLFQLLTGALPFDGGSTADTLRRIMTDPAPPLSKYMADCPAELEAIVQKSLARNRTERYSSAEDFALDLARVQQQSMKKLLAETLQEAGESLRRKDFTAAAQRVQQVLRAAPQDLQGAELLRQIKQGQEQQEREQRILQLQMKAEEAFRKNRLAEARQFVDQGMALDPEGGIFSGLRDAIADAQARAEKYKESIKQAETALRAGDLETAKNCVEQAQGIFPDDPAARAVAGQIIARLEQQLQEQRAAEKQRQLARTLNAFERAMADARMLAYLGQSADALQALDKVENEVAQLPPQWAQQFDALKKEVRDKIAEQNRPQAPTLAAAGAHTAELPDGGSATVLMEPNMSPPDVASDLPVADVGEVYAPTAEGNPFAHASQGLPEADIPYDVLYPSGQLPRRPAEIAPELREFLEPEPRWWSRSAIWFGVAVGVIVIVLLWLLVRPGLLTQARKTPPIASAYTYAEINAEPWATVTAINPANADAQKIVGQQTPLRAKLAPGQYTVTLQGPDHEEKQVSVTVPPQGGTTTFAVFRKPDLNKIVGTQ